MLRHRLLLKSFAAFFILEILLSTVAPAITYALTAGPTAPEATSFEPIDTTDLVNTITGDFVYNVPLLEVPGPGGSYPLSLAYHGGIQPNVDASWVGLGWSLNPGSINRLSNGLPDDYNGSKSTNRIFWEGGEMTVDTYGVSIGIGGVATVSAGLSFANDTYKGRGVGGSLGLTLGKNLGSYGSVGISGTIGISPYGDTYASAGVSLGVGMSTGVVSASGRVGLSINSSGKVSAGLSGGVSASSGGANVGASASLTSAGLSGELSGGTSLMGASISTNGKVGIKGAVGISSQSNNSMAGKVTNRESHSAIDIPVWYGINIHLGRDTYRYFMDQRETYDNFGSLYFPNGNVPAMETKLFDSYHIQGLPSLANGGSPANSPDGSFADYDSYNVNAQGLGGNIRPYHYNLTLYSQDIVSKQDNSKEILGYYIPQQSTGVQFRFENDFSNRVINDPPDIEINKVYTTLNYPPGGIKSYEDYVNYSNGVYATSQTVPLYFPYSSPQTGIEGYEEPGTKRYIPKIPGSKHIEYFTNDKIIRGQTIASARDSLVAEGFRECNAAGFTRTSAATGKVGAFSITNESGVTYHFSLPAYSSLEYTYSQNKDTKDKISFNMMEQKDKYAYTWYLTGITGPDYVDRGPSGPADYIINEHDWGYWVEFEYGKWTNNYRWRNPAEGYNDDFDPRQKSFSKGIKEVYYLNAIKTKTHTALFVKEIRADGKSVSQQNDGAVITTPNKEVTWVDEGGFDIKTILVTPVVNEIDNTIDTVGSYYDFPVSSMKLNSIYLFDNTTLNTANPNSISSISTKYNSSYNYSYTYSHTDIDGVVSQKNFSKTIPVHLGQNVIDIQDIASSSIPVANALRKIDLNYSYDLSLGTANSYDATGSMYECTTCSNFTPNLTIPNTKLGKLSLNSVAFKGRGGVQSMPSMKFTYDLPDEPFKNSIISSIDTYKKQLVIQTGQQSDDFQFGDIVVFTQSSKKYYGYVNENSTSIAVTCISPTLPVTGNITELKRTKNPPYNKEFTDMWGFYKVDKTNSTSPLNNFTTPISGKNVDAWSLRQIRTSMGSKINVAYESDTYSESIYSKNLLLPLSVSNNTTDVTPVPESYIYSHQAKFFFTIDLPANSAFNLTELYQVGDVMDLASAFSGCDINGQNCYYTIISAGTVQEVSTTSVRVRVFAPYQTSLLNYGGVAQVGSRTKNYGGGLRVKALQIVNSLANTTNSTEYAYEFDNKSSGVTTYEPIAMKNSNVSSQEYPSLANSFLYQIYQRFHDILALGRDIPAPGIYYGKVKISEKVIRPGLEVEIPGYSIFEFETFNKDMIGWDNTSPPPVYSSGSFKSQLYGSITKSKVALKNFALRMGTLKTITLFDKDGKKINETINHYLHDQQTSKNFLANKNEYPALINNYRNQGVIQETFNHARWVKKGSTGQLQGLISKKELYPVVQTGSTTTNFKTGIKTKTENLEYDFYSGTVTKKVMSDGMNNYFVTESRPAYKFYPSMGFKTDNNANKHMITQNALNYVYKVDPANYATKTRLVGASVQTWSDQIPSVQPGLANSAQTGIWRMAANFSYIGDPTAIVTGDGLLPVVSNTLPDFTTWNDLTSVPAGWQKNVQIGLYDIYSHALEATDINGLSSSTKMSSNQELVLASVTDASYKECVYSGAEDAVVSGAYGGGVLKSNGTERTKANANDVTTTHTGQKSLRISSTSHKAFLYSFTAKRDQDYLASVWMNTTAGRLYYSINGTTTTSPGIPSAQSKVGSWYLVTIKIPKSTSDATVQVWCGTTGTCNFDDFRVHPYGATMVSYVYNKWGELSHILNANNFYTEYLYDEAGRLIRVNQETIQYGVVKSSESTLHYGLND